jgi:hypothetical protein
MNFAAGLPHGCCEVCFNLNCAALKIDRSACGRLHFLPEWELSSLRGCPSCKVVVGAIKYHCSEADMLDTVTLVRSPLFRSLMIVLGAEPYEALLPSDRWIQLSLCPSEFYPYCRVFGDR